ncbi:amyloid-beta A4 precursor protein-binding family A member 2-like isoform X3 [Mytilus edulis]|uniref:amyloid-beta A4 precursor protein-binding family A member 2-like isoform X3 n=1 Tax=Mytilus edulis TaxID=6550 RepID=UPI0039F1353E
MSDNEDNAPSDQEDSGQPESVATGACGGDFLRPISPNSDSADNLSLEVQFEEESSRHPSELSSISYQNLLDDGDGNGLSRHESEDSADSLPPDFNDMYQQDEITQIDIRDLQSKTNEKYKKSCLNAIQLKSQCESDNIDKLTIDVSKMKDLIQGETKESPDISMKSDKESKNHSAVQKRNSLEIRNNIPVKGEVKSYNKDLDNLIKYNSQGAKPKIKKKSPGVACRIGDSGSDREGSSSERDVPLKKQYTDVSECEIQPHFTKHDSVHKLDKEKESLDTKNLSEFENLNPKLLENSKTVEIINEYDYVKYSRVQDGDSYVGMRLAYSSKEEKDKNNINGILPMDDDNSRDASPDKIVNIKQELSLLENIQNLNEDMLTEIPLNNNDGFCMHDQKAFSLSPENTECDSAEVESVVSDDDKSNLGMPNVEDGLSSSQTSDVEDAPPSSMHKSPTHLLRKKQSQVVDEQLSNSENSTKAKEIDASAIMEDLKAKREALDLAIADIKSTIHSSKDKIKYTPQSDEDAEPVWIMRENSHDKKEDRVRQSNHSSEGIYSEIHDKDNEESGETNQLLESQTYKSDGRLYHASKGYDSDDEEDNNSKSTRRIRGKKYTSLPKDDSFDQHSHRVNGANGHHVNNHQKSESVEYYIKKTHEGSETDSEYGSDKESPSKTSYVKQERQPGDYDTDEETDHLLQKQYQKDQNVDIPELSQPPAEKRRSRAKEGERQSSSVYDPENPSVLIEGVLFRARYLGSTQLISEGQPSKAMRMMQAQEAVGRIKAPEGENQPSTAVDLFVSTEKIMVLNTDLQEIMMDHALRTISYIADIGDILVIMARRRILSSPGDDSLRKKKQAKILCHVFESDEAQLIAQSIGQAFQVAYMEFLKANGIEDPGLMKEIDYQDVLNQQEIYGEELNLFANKEKHKEVIVPKVKGESLGVVIVESGWGSMVPTVVVANMAPTGPAARCGMMNIGDQIISVNGVSLVGLPLSSCQNYIKSSKQQTVVKLSVVPCPPVVEVLVKRPDVKYQLGFSVQNGVICSLLRGGIAERGGVRVGHRIIEINNQSVVAVPHEKIVALLANSVGEIHMKTMPTSIFRLLTGQETPHYM